MKWCHVKWTESKWSDVMWSEVKGSEVKGSEVMLCEVKLCHVKWSDVMWSEWKWSALKWSEVMSCEVNGSEVQWSEVISFEVKSWWMYRPLVEFYYICPTNASWISKKPNAEIRFVNVPALSLFIVQSLHCLLNPVYKDGHSRSSINQHYNNLSLI